MTPPDGVLMIPIAGDAAPSDGRGRQRLASTASLRDDPLVVWDERRVVATSGPTIYVDAMPLYLNFLVYFSSVGEVLGDDMDRIVTITELPGHEVRAPIEVLVSDRDGDVVASFEGAGLSMSGADEREAIDMLAEQIADVFDTYRREPKLGAWAKKQLRVLEAYIGEKGRKPNKAPRG